MPWIRANADYHRFKFYDMTNIKNAWFRYFMVALLVIPAGLLLFSAANWKGHKKHEHRIVIQFSSRDSLSADGLMHNLRNIEKDWPEAKIEVVFHGGGLDMMLTKTTRYAKDLEMLHDQGVEMVVCENTMARRKVTKADLLPFAGTVPMGVGEVVLKQEDGWSYLKGGN